MGTDDPSPPESAGQPRQEDPQRTVDAIIDWIRERRCRSPNSPLSQLLDDAPLAPDVLLDLACIDLIGRRRGGHLVRVEDYLSDFPELRNESNTLDLIDAEICIDRELGEDPSLEDLATRFPSLRQQIADLLQMNIDGKPELAFVGDLADENDVISTQATGDFELLDSESMQIMLAPSGAAESGGADVAEADFSLQQAFDTRKGGTLSPTSHPVDVPDWFVGEQCVASGVGRWLIRGRDATRGETLAMKVIELPVQISPQQVDQLMNACELAAKVRHPAWSVPAVAAVQDRRLAVIRHWLFANPWQPKPAAIAIDVRLRQMASVAYALQSAHSIGASHGGVHATNLLVDHLGKVHVVDCCCATTIVPRWFEANCLFASFQRRRQLDVQDMIKLVVTDAVDWSVSWTDDLVTTLRKIADQHSADAAGIIGDTLMSWADQQSGLAPVDGNRAIRRSLKARLSKWISGP